MQSRRNILNILGFAAVGSSTMNVERLDTMEYGVRTVPGLMQRSPETQQRIAGALENMAAAIRSGEMTADKIEVLSTATLENWMRHEVRVHCEVALPNDVT